MKSLLIKAIVCCVALVPFTQAQASGPAGKNFYDLTPKTKFKLKCTSVVGTVAELGKNPKVIKSAPGIPKFSKNKIYTFKIGDKGQLTGQGDLKGDTVSIAYKSATQGTTIYVNKMKGTQLPDGAVVRTDSVTKKAVYTQLDFHKVVGSGFNTKTYFFVYVFQ